MPRRRRRRKRACLTQTACCAPPERRTAYRSTKDLPEHLATDQLIRQLGFSIHTRASGKLTLWQRGGSTYSQEEILTRYVSEEEIWEMEYRQMMEDALETGDGL